MTPVQFACPLCHGHPPEVPADPACKLCHGEKYEVSDPHPWQSAIDRHPRMWWALAAFGVLLIVAAKAFASCVSP